MPAAIAIASIAATAYAAHKQASAAKDAASMQQQSVNRAQDFNQQAWQAQQTALKPYQQAGQYSLANLMANYGDSNPALQAQRTNAYVNAAQQRTPMQGFPLAQPQMALGGQTPQAPPQAMPPGNSARVPPQTATVPMVGPDGSIAQVPQQNVMEAMRRGARVM